MKNQPAPNPARRRPSAWLGLATFATAVVLFALLAHPFLAISTPVQADTMVIEGWVPPYVLKAAAAEFAHHGYSRVFVSGLESTDNRETDAARSVRELVALGIDPAKIVEATCAAAGFNRTSHMARAVRDRMRALGVRPSGVNVVTLGPHARQSRLAYQRLLGAETPVGVISIPKNDYDPSFWWASRAGIMKTTKDFAGWLKEELVGLRS